MGGCVQCIEKNKQILPVSFDKGHSFDHFILSKVELIKLVKLLDK